MNKIDFFIWFYVDFEIDYREFHMYTKERPVNTSISLFYS